MTTNGRVIFNSIPSGYPEPDKTLVFDTSETIDVDNVPLNGGILIKVLELSADPYMRGRMRDPSLPSFFPAFPLGEVITGYGLGVVVRSESTEAKAGDHVYGLLEYQQYIIRPSLAADDGLRIVENKENLPWSLYVGVLGMPGKTAYMAWKEYSRAKKGETVFVTVGAGSVGSLVIQLAKQDGLKVIASAGSEDKVQFMKDVGADVAFNYKTTDTAEVLAKEGPIDVYWDNVGGKSLEAALDAAIVGARFIECGMISGYNNESEHVRNLWMIFGKSISMQGFIVGRIAPKYEEEFYATLPPKVASGEIQYREHIFNGIEKTGEAIIAVQKGTNTGRAVIHVADN